MINKIFSYKKTPESLSENESRHSKSSVEVKKVQVGCGPKNLLNGWWNVDIREFEGIDQVMDVAQPWPWKNCLSYIYGEHFLEHLTVQQSIDFLIYAGDALLTGGKIRLSTPSLEWVLKSHFKFENDSVDARVQHTWQINRAFHGWGHQFLYTKEMLQTLLEAVGFDEINWCEYGKSNDPNLNNLERHGEPSFAFGYPSVWTVEASKTKVNMVKDDDFFESAELNFLRYVRHGH